MRIEQNISLAPFTTFRVGGPAAFFCRVRYLDDLHEASAFIKEKNRHFFVLGEGSNTLVADAGFNGLVIKIDFGGIKEVVQKSEHSQYNESGHGYNYMTLQVAAGEHWDSLVEYAVRKKLYGIENLSGIPGSVGAAVVGNIGAYGTEFEEVIESVECFDMQKSKLVNFNKEECKFSYRHSFFKEPTAAHLIVTKVTIRLVKEGESKEGGVAKARVHIGYKDLKEYFKDRYSSDISLEEIRAAVLEIRARKLPDITKLGTAGSFFKNPIVSVAHYEKLREQYPDMPGFPEEGGVEQGQETARIKIPAAWILDKVCGMKGWREGDVGTYENQALVLVNYGNATAGQIETAARRMSQAVRDKTGIVLEWEVQRVG